MVWNSFVANARDSIEITAISKAQLEPYKKKHPSASAWLDDLSYRAEPGTVAFIPRDGRLAEVLLGIGEEPMWDFAAAQKRLPPGVYRVSGRRHGVEACLGFALGSYRFDSYRTKKSKTGPTLVWPSGVDKNEIQRIVDGVCLGRDLINTPAEDLAPEALARSARSMAKRLGASCTVIKGAGLLQKNYPAVHAVSTLR